jgi:hypothetical protein
MLHDCESLLLVVVVRWWWWWFFQERLCLLRVPGVLAF